MRELVLNWVIHVWENPDGRTYGRDKLWGHLVFTGMPSPAVTAAAAESRHCRTLPRARGTYLLGVRTGLPIHGTCAP